MEANDTTPAIVAGRISLHQHDDGVTIRHHGKQGVVEVVIDAARLERWAVKTLREEMFSPARSAA